jgi:hypothetical protein
VAAAVYAGVASPPGFIFAVSASYPMLILAAHEGGHYFKKKGKYMFKRLLVVGALSLSVSAMAAHHEETPMISEFYECSLNDGVAVSQVLDFARSDFKAFADKNDFAMNSFIWEAVAVSPPYDEPDLRWVNYFPTWGDYFASEEAWRSTAQDVAADLFELVSCSKARTLAVHNAGAQPPASQEKPLIAMVCNLDEGKSVGDALAYRKAVNKMANSMIDGSVGSAVFTPALGIAGFDYVAMVTGTTEDMANVMDNVRSGKALKAMRAAGIENPAQCVTDLHRSHLVVSR